MKYTNKNNISQIFCDWLTQDDYDLKSVKNNVFSVTELLNPVKILLLKRRHYNELYEEVSECIWRVFGSTIHAIFERVNKKNYIHEQRFYYNLTKDIIEVSPNDTDIYITGKIDLYDKDKKQIEDFKITSVWGMIYNPKGKDDWIYQLNCYKIFLEKSNLPVDKIWVNAIFRDWNYKDVKGNYPSQPIKSIPIEIKESSFMIQWMKDKISEVMKYIKLDDNKIPECKSYERFRRKDGYETRCHRYCNVNCFCNYYKQLQEKK